MIAIRSLLNKNAPIYSLVRNYASCCGGGNKMPQAPGEIELDDFFKVDLRVAEVLKAEHIEGAKKLIKFQLLLGKKKNTITDANGNTQTEETPDIRTVYSGIKKYYPNPETLVGKNVIMVANLKPKANKFGISEGMVLCASDDDSTKVLLATTDVGSEPGMKVL
ncbi:methionyl-trna synthetase beta subunit [Tieghemostelium lacteum]|uniref:Methionyl-trna synthetase beta subunit n=1 Tax=Tieghemostelium lacteum TaxID=361077 RepID=A0A151Z3S7_TIELA|nr:methionyl-trna synthetase beta subunit [Tieghemostelium lacteum]|eukprot:KYQ88454.1 methionyl-trna synthetase beta subunit [Tieghemostelium lacteum]